MPPVTNPAARELPDAIKHHRPLKKRTYIIPGSEPTIIALAVRHVDFGYTSVDISKVPHPLHESLVTFCQTFEITVKNRFATFSSNNDFIKYMDTAYARYMGSIRGKEFFEQLQFPDQLPFFSPLTSSIHELIDSYSKQPMKSEETLREMFTMAMNKVGIRDADAITVGFVSLCACINNKVGFAKGEPSAIWEEKRTKYTSVIAEPNARREDTATSTASASIQTATIGTASTSTANAVLPPPRPSSLPLPSPLPQGYEARLELLPPPSPVSELSENIVSSRRTPSPQFSADDEIEAGVALTMLSENTASSSSSHISNQKIINHTVLLEVQWANNYSITHRAIFNKECLDKMISSLQSYASEATTKAYKISFSSDTEGQAKTYQEYYLSKDTIEQIIKTFENIVKSLDTSNEVDYVEGSEESEERLRRKHSQDDVASSPDYKKPRSTSP